MKKESPIETLLLQWKESWPKAKLVWNPFVKLREPLWCMTSKAAAKEGLTGSFAMIRLNDHRIVIDMEKVFKEEVGDFSTEVLAHEIGHHVYSPANLHDNATLLSRIRWGLAGIEDRAPFVANIYADLLINDTLQRTKNLNMAGVYQALNKEESVSKVWLFFMRTCEYLWKLERGTLAKSKAPRSAAIDADASLAASLIRSYSKKWLDGGGRFAALLFPYLMEDEDYQKARTAFILQLDAENAGEGGGMVTGLTELDLEGMEGAIDPRREGGSDEGKNGKPNALGINEKGGQGPRQRYLHPGAYVDLLRQINPKADEQELINNYYREIALPHLVSFPLETSNPTSMTLPEGTENWDSSDPMEEIDWVESAIASPIIFPGYSTLKRVYGSEEDESETKKPLDVYIGIDCSGSMGNPRVSFSWPILAATVIGLSALRAGAKVMGCLSGEPGSFMETDGFRSSDKEVLTVLTSYLGTGYAYGVPRLKTPFGKPAKKKSHIVVVTDDDIFSMLDAEKQTGKESNWAIIESALQNAGGVGTLVLHSNGDWHKPEVQRLQDMGWHIYYVTNEQQLLDFAARFSQDHYQFKPVKMVEIFNLIHHLKRCPEEFLHTWVSKPGKKPQADVLVKDIYRRIIGDFTVPDSDLPDINKGFWQLDENQVISIQIGCWFFSYPFFLKKLPLLPMIHLFLFNDLMEVCKFVKYREWVEDDDRAEEFIRLALKICDILPQGETPAEASDKLEALDTLKRQEVLRESNAFMDRIREIRRQMAEQKAREAANVYSRE